MRGAAHAGTAAAADLPFLWQSNADDHDARSFDVVSIRYDGDWEPLTYVPGQ